MPNSLLQHFPGPRFGQAGLRRLVGVDTRPLLGTTLKPMGLSAGDLAGLAYQPAKPFRKLSMPYPAQWSEKGGV